jgi:hypothetical protein
LEQYNIDFKLYYRAIVKKRKIKKTAWYWHKTRHEDQYNGMEELNTNSHNYSHLIFDKSSQNIY